MIESYTQYAIALTIEHSIDQLTDRIIKVMTLSRLKKFLFGLLLFRGGFPLLLSVHALIDFNDTYGRFSFGLFSSFPRPARLYYARLRQEKLSTKSTTKITFPDNLELVVIIS